MSAKPVWQRTLLVQTAHYDRRRRPLCQPCGEGVEQVLSHIGWKQEFQLFGDSFPSSVTLPPHWDEDGKPDRSLAEVPLVELSDSPDYAVATKGQQAEPLTRSEVLPPEPIPLPGVKRRRDL